MNDLIIVPIALLALHLLNCLLENAPEIPSLLGPEERNLAHVLQEEDFDGLSACHSQKHIVEIIKSVLIIAT